MSEIQVLLQLLSEASCHGILMLATLLVAIIAILRDMIKS